MLFEHQISDVFQFVSCRYRWYLCRVLMMDFDNIYTIRGSIAHKRREKRVLRKNSEREYEQFDLTVTDGERLRGVCDAVLFIADDNGIYIPKVSSTQDDLFSIVPIEYKPKKLSEKLNHPTKMQCVAQAACLSQTYSCKVDKYYVYYQQEHRRSKHCITEKDYAELKSILDEMDTLLRKREIPDKTADEDWCFGCLALEYCKPTSKFIGDNFSSYLEKAGK